MSLTTSPIEPAHWMRDLYDRIKGQPFSQVPLPGSHDSGAYGDFNYTSLARTQSLPIDQQLVLGIRYFDFRVRARQGIFYAHHGTVATNNDFLAPDGENGILPDILAFLEQHPGEILILNCTHFDNSDSGSGWGNRDDLRNQAFVDLVAKQLDGRLIGRGPLGPYEKFEDLLGRGQAILITDFAVTNDPHQLAWLESEDIIDYYAPPTISVPTGGIGVGGNGTGVQASQVKTLIDGLDSARSTSQKRRKFYKYQGIFKYDAIDIPNFDSMMQYGAGILNAVIVAHYRDLVVESAIAGSATPNIILVDYVDLGGIVESIVDAVYYSFPGPSGDSRQALHWRSVGRDGAFDDGWVTQNPNWDFIGGNVYAPEEHLVAIWVKGESIYGVVDFAEWYVPALGKGINPVPGSSPPMNLNWHYGKLYSEVDDIALLTVPDNEEIIGIEVVEQSRHGIVNVRVRSSSGAVSEAAFDSRPTSPWIAGGHPTQETVTALESAYGATYGVIDIRYALLPDKAP